MSEWNPDPDLLGFMLSYFDDSDKERVSDGSRMLTWKQVGEEVKRGTPFGREYYSAWEKIMARSPAMQRDFKKWKKDRKP